MRKYLMSHNAITGERVYLITVPVTDSNFEENIEYYLQVRIGEHKVSDYVYTFGVMAKDKMTATQLHRLFQNGYFDLWVEEIKEKMYEEV